MSGFREGELIISSTPYVYVLKDRFRGQFCEYCFKKNGELKRCSQCHHLYYCGKNCQKKAWEMHKTECKFLKERPLPAPRIRLIILALMKVRKYFYEEPFEEFGNRRASMASLMSHAENFKKNRLELLIMAKDVIERYIGSDNVPPFDEFVEIFGKLDINAFTIENCCPVIGKFGEGLYLGPSLFDHSCDADAAFTFDGTTLNVRMMRNVPHRDISQVRISYLNVMSLNEERREKCLKKFFVCSCSLCTSPKSDELLTKLVSDDPEIKEKAMKCKEEAEYIFSICNIEPQLLYGECKRLLESQSGVLADTNVYRIRTLEAAFHASEKLEKLEEAVEFGSHLEKPFRMRYCANDPNLGCFLLKYGMCLYLLGRNQEAVPILSEAETKLKIIYGEHHSLVSQNREMSTLASMLRIIEKTQGKKIDMSSFMGC